jgi:hypothetical protein
VILNFIVNVDHLTDKELEFYGWFRINQGEKFSLYWNPRYNEAQPVENNRHGILWWTTGTTPSRWAWAL